MCTPSAMKQNITGCSKNATATKQCTTFFNITNISKIFYTRVVLLYLILNLTPVLLGGSSTDSAKSLMSLPVVCCNYQKVQVGNDQEKTQSEREPLSKNRGGKKKKQQSGTYTIKHIVSRLSNYFPNPGNGKQVTKCNFQAFSSLNFSLTMDKMWMKLL